MVRSFLFGLLIFCISASSWGQSPYSTSGSKETSILAPGAGILGGSILLSKKVEPLTPEAIASLDPNSIWGVDRWVTRSFSPWAAEFSDNFLFSSYALPLTLLLDQPSRKDFGKVGLFTLESLIANNGITNLTKVLAKRIRPFVYNPNIPLPMKVSKKARYSFFSGHASNTACMYFLTASMFSDFYPDSNLRPFVWTTAIVVPAFTGYLRMRAGKHFLSDVVVGYLVGAAVGMIIPALHK